mgnify:CR=1 FL=1
MPSGSLRATVGTATAQLVGKGNLAALPGFLQIQCKVTNASSKNYAFAALHGCKTMTIDAAATILTRRHAHVEFLGGADGDLDFSPAANPNTHKRLYHADRPDHRPLCIRRDAAEQQGVGTAKHG